MTHTVQSVPRALIDTAQKVKIFPLRSSSTHFKFTVSSPVDRSSLPTLLANRFASTTSTDVPRILPLTRLTFKLNPNLLNGENECRIFPLDWSKEIRNFDRYYDTVLAAECCYNRDTSKNLFNLINWLFKEEKLKMAIFTLEERPNFMLDSMSVRSTERDRNGSKAL